MKNPVYPGALFFILLFVFLLMAACQKHDVSADIIPPVTAPLSRSIIGYGVITSNYTHILDRKEGGTALALLRKGAIVEIKERQVLLVNGKAENHVFVSFAANSGWLAENELNIYGSLAQAETAAKNLNVQAAQQ